MHQFPFTVFGHAILDLILYAKNAIVDISGGGGGGGGVGVVGGVMVLGKFPSILMIIGQGPIALTVGAGGGCLDILLSSIFSIFFLPLSGRWPNID